IVNDPNYFLCDEPNPGWDPQTSILIDELIADISEDLDITTIVATHDMHSVMGTGARLMFIYTGHHVCMGNNKDITHSGVKELDDFVFANKVMSSLREK